MTSTIRFSTFPRTQSPPEWTQSLVSVFVRHEQSITTIGREKGLTSDAVLSILTPDLLVLGFEVERGKSNIEKIKRPVFFGENGKPALQYEVDAFHPAWRCGLEVEAGRTWLGNAVYRNLIQALVMVDLNVLVLAVPNGYRRKSMGRTVVSKDYEATCAVADTLYGHNRMNMPYSLIIVGYWDMKKK